MRHKTRLSYVEILITAAVLVLVAKAVKPQMVEAGTGKKISHLIDRLEPMRAQLDLYKVHHGGCLPPADSFAGFQAAMTTRAGGYGPYIRKIPMNPFNNLNTVRFDGEPAGAGKAGWRLDTRTGLFQADNAAGYAAL